MADSNETTTVEALRGELDKLSGQIGNIIKSIEDKKSAEASDLVDKLTRELAALRSGASDKAQKLYDAGQAGVEEVGEHIRRNPLSSLLIAFGAGCVLSCLLRHLSK